MWAGLKAEGKVGPRLEPEDSPFPVVECVTRSEANGKALARAGGSAAFGHRRSDSNTSDGPEGESGSGGADLDDDLADVALESAEMFCPSTLTSSSSSHPSSGLLRSSDIGQEEEKDDQPHDDSYQPPDDDDQPPCLRPATGRESVAFASFILQVWIPHTPGAFSA